MRTTGTAWRIMFEPIRARFASSFSRNGTSDAATRHKLVRGDVHQRDNARLHHDEVTTARAGSDKPRSVAALLRRVPCLRDDVHPLPLSDNSSSRTS